MAPAFTETVYLQWLLAFALGQTMTAQKSPLYKAL
jgi:hypothetical protein